MFRLLDVVSQWRVSGLELRMPGTPVVKTGVAAGARVVGEYATAPHVSPFYVPTAFMLLSACILSASAGLGGKGATARGPRCFSLR